MHDPNSQGILDWRTWVLSDRDAASEALRALHESDPARFGEVAHALARDDDSDVAVSGLRQLGLYGERDDAEGDAIARAQLLGGSRSVKNAALRVLGKVGLASAFPLLESQLIPLTPDSHVVLNALAQQARTPEQRARVLELARRLVLAQYVQVRIMAVRILRGLSSVPAEEGLLLEAAQQHPDETTLAALRHATPQALPRLREIRAMLREGSAQWQDATKAIEAIEQCNR